MTMISLALSPCNAAVLGGERLKQNLMSYSEDLRFHWTFGPGGSGQNTSSTLLNAVTVEQLPDASGGDVGEGFTCTGLAKDSTDSTWWVGNDGRNLDGDTTYQTSIVHLDTDRVTKLSEFSIPQLGVQGVAEDKTDHTLWHCGNADQFIFHRDKSGNLLGQITFAGSQPNGLCDDGIRNRLWVTNGNNLSRVNKTTGSVEHVFDTAGLGPDHICHDPDRDFIWITAGANNAQGRLIAYDVAHDRVVHDFTLDTARAIEGCWVEGTAITIVDDGYFHSAPPGNVPAPYNINSIQTYTLPGSLPAMVYQRAFGSYAMGPFGRMADRIILNKGSGTANTDFAFIGRNSDAAAGVQATFSIYMKPTFSGDSLVVGQRLLNGTQVAKTISGEWQRFSVTATTAATAQAQIVLRGTFGTANFADILVTAAMVELGPTATKYNPRLGA